MILGVDHITLTCTDIDRGVRLLEQLGYQTRFIHRDLPNHPSKSEILRNYTLTHSIAFCRLANSVPIELVQYSDYQLPAVGPCQLTWSNIVIMIIPNLTTSARFWIDGLGFKLFRTDFTGPLAWFRLTFHTPVAGWSTDVVLLGGTTPFISTYLDDVGYTCLAFLSTDIDQDVDNLTKAGGQAVTDKFPLEVNGKLLDVIILRGPSGELVELLGVRDANS